MIYALHEHELKPQADEVLYNKEISNALGDLTIPGLLHAAHLKGIKGKRSSKYAILWIFESETALMDNFGTPDNPKLPEKRLHYENNVLAPFLDRHPDTINFTDYRILYSTTVPCFNAKQP